MSLGVAACLAYLIATAAEAQAGDMQFRIRLIWGTNQDKSKHPSLQEVESALVDKLRKIFKWEHYFRVKDESLTVSDGEAKRKVLSDKCEVEVKNLTRSMLEVKLWGEGKLVKTVKHAAVPGECLVLAGDGKNDTAWFVVLTPHMPEKGK